jgi:hypothetical protein
VGEHDEVIEVEPNETPQQATPVEAVPVALDGRLERPGDRDYFQFAGKKGQRLSFAARTRSLGSPCFVRLRLLKPDGSSLAESKTDGPGEGALDATLPDEGAYRLMVEDINRAGGPGLAYRVEVEPDNPGFTLTVDTDRVNAKPGEGFEVKVTCVRRDYTGPITLAVDGKGVTSEPATIAAGKNEAVLKGRAPETIESARSLPFRIVGTAEAGGRGGTVEANTLPALRRVYPRLLYPPDETDGVLVLGVRAPAE